jgi:hypothetical protein
MAARGGVPIYPPRLTEHDRPRRRIIPTPQNYGTEAPQPTIAGKGTKPMATIVRVHSTAVRYASAH